MAGIDILGMGAAAVDDLIQVAAYPAADHKEPIAGRERQGGGLTATALVAAARLGVNCSYAGVLGTDELSDFVAANFQREGVDVSHLQRREGAKPVYAIVIVDQSSGGRTIFYDLTGVVGAAEDWPPEDVIRSCKVLFVDSLGMPGMIRAARIARQAGLPVVADLEIISPYYDELSALVDHMIVSEEFACRTSGTDAPAAAAAALWGAQRSAVVVTCGAEGCWYLESGDAREARHFPAYKVDVVDTTGCGDVFHGAYAAGLVKGLGLEERVRVASGVAALKATRRGGQPGAPTWEALQSFLMERS